MITKKTVSLNLVEVLTKADSILIECMREFHRSGFTIWFVGGAVRDAALGKALSDIDLVVDRDPISKARSFAKRLGLGFVILDNTRKIVRLAIKSTPQMNIDIALTQGSSINDDLLCRDFTINAIAALWQDDGFTVTDPLNGIGDLNEKILRPVLSSAIADDPVRIIRAYRFQLEYSLSVSASLTGLISNARNMLSEAPAERIAPELIHIFNHQESYTAVRKMADDAVLDVIFPELTAMRGVTQNEWHHLDVFDHTLETLRCLDETVQNPPSWLLPWKQVIDEALDEEVSSGFSRLIVIKIAALYHDVGKPVCRRVDETGKVTFYGHEKAGANLAAGAATRLRFPNSVGKGLALLVRHHLRPFNAISNGTITRRAIYRYCRDLGSYAIPALVLGVADSNATRGSAVTKAYRENCRVAIVEVLRYLDALSAKIEPQKQLVNGHDIMKKFNLAPGALVGKLLYEIEEAFAVGEIENREEAYLLVERLLANER